MASPAPLTPNDIRFSGWAVVQDERTGFYQGRALLFPTDTDSFAFKEELIAELRRAMGIPPEMFDLPIH